MSQNGDPISSITINQQRQLLTEKTSPKLESVYAILKKRCIYIVVCTDFKKVCCAKSVLTNQAV
jgi:hypothetical protein